MVSYNEGNDKQESRGNGRYHRAKSTRIAEILPTVFFSLEGVV